MMINLLLNKFSEHFATIIVIYNQNYVKKTLCECYNYLAVFQKNPVYFSGLR